MDFSKSKCKGTWLHNYQLVAEYWGEAVKERCTRCGKEVVFKLDPRGLADNTNYLKYHMRQALVPQHPLFAHEFPHA